jgi:opacity protein-like surface antigen
MDTSFARESVPLSGSAWGEGMTDQKARFWLIAATLGTILPAGAAVLAADLPVKARPLAPPYYDWSGVYVGVHAGYGGGMTDWNDQGFDFAPRGFLGGGQVGINKQIASLVFGLELDGSWANFNRSQTFSFGGPILGFQSVGSATSKIDGFLTLAGRAGLAADRWFVYAKGGLAFAHDKHAFGVVATQFPGGGVDSFAVSGSEDRWGLMVGFGTEYALGSNWSVKAEYDYMNFGSRTPRLAGTETVAGVTSPITIDSQIEQAAIHVAKVGVNYRFGGLQIDPTFAPVPAAPGHNWSGAYVGAQGGYGFGHKEWPDFFGVTPASGKFDANGWLAGGTVGVNAQAGAFVFGVEGEWMWTGIKGSQTVTTDFGGASFTDSLESKINWLAVASARAGFVVGDRLLVYAKGGVALADEKHSHDLAQSVIGLGTVTASASGRAVHTGIVVGAGAEYALGGNWSAKLEYDYIRMLAQNVIATGTETANIPAVAVGTIDFAEQFTGIRQDLHLVKLGVNYHFNPVPMVVSARY